MNYVYTSDRELECGKNEWMYYMSNYERKCLKINVHVCVQVLSVKDNVFLLTSSVEFYFCNDKTCIGQENNSLYTCTIFTVVLEDSINWLKSNNHMLHLHFVDSHICVWVYTKAIFYLAVLLIRPF
jgi:hypothetical protein